MTDCGCACHADFPGEPGCPQLARVVTARRDALTEAADEVRRIRDEDDDGPYAKHFETWLRARATEATP